ncbi:hypothetical protein [Phenylobacterium sp.]|jgi:hypothetical protein|uniref:glycosyltransferase family 9 protein n=1 Tax=Phenylobacterium sp. TaxID=1871053 RepID=UPI002E3695CB|nr:hypothetical protein [Phenylobacterium sp.]HEX2559500.1 hypothetical protein [Phenylobacterium sp.]
MPVLSAQEAFNAAVQAHREGRLADAEKVYRVLAPYYWRARDNLGLLLLADGRLEEGFALYEGRFTRPERRVEKPALSFPEWGGERVGSLLVWPEQGFGDQILHARWIGELARRGVEVTLLCPPPLIRLFDQLPARMLAQEGQLQVPRHEAFVMLGSLPFRCGASAASVPAEPYLKAEPAPGDGIGVCWRGDPRYPGNAARSLSPEAAERLSRLGRSLLPEDTGANDFMETAEIIAGLDLVITVDTSIANLAGALGKRCWVLLAQPCDWRWMRSGAATPWYPSARLFRQPSAGDWTSVLDEVERELGP